MHPVLRNILVVIGGLIIGSFVNMGIIMISGSIIPPPEGVDPSNIESLKNGMDQFEAKHFLFPFLAHALGTLVGAIFAGKFSASRKLAMSLIIGVFFLIGGIMNVYMLPSPTWFSIVDLVFAYIPMAILGYKIGK
ncbi:hypothetical protein [Salibacter halophilus]|uniref:Uncharacterized protein n=1 Tax=Salibacter halophilus TaxID=1803916 RepID=A0A6N6M7K3_9FLAO|nr:hypothetical protein [Salibacter halophilus]KAB1066058.1 hypothetical protein F3059_00900 [Salibacter halophilus]